MIKTCGMNVDIESFYDLYAKLSNQIHNSPWNGDAVQIYAEDLKPEYTCLLKQIAKHFYLKSELVTSTIAAASANDQDDEGAPRSAL
jgi:hypothetical protein